MNEPTVRSYRPADFESVVDLWRSTFSDTSAWNEAEGVVERKREVQGELFLVCEVDGQLVGTVLAGFDGVRGWVHHLAVLPAFRRRGFATALMRAAETGLADRGCPKLNLQVRASNPGAVAFYQRLGYAIEERISLGKPLGRWVAA